MGAAEWKAKTHLDIFSNHKALYRLGVAVDKVKQQLSGYTSTVKLPINVECLQDDRDFASHIDTDMWTEMTRSLCERALEPVKAAISERPMNKCIHIDDCCLLQLGVV